MNRQSPVKVVVLGGGYAGTLAALRLTGKSEGHLAEITLVNGADHFVERIRHHQRASGQRQQRLPFKKLLAGSGVRFLQGWCTEILPAAKELRLQTATGPEIVAYDYLIYALGSTVDKVGLAGVTTNVYTLGDEQTVQALAERLPAMAANHERLLIVGGGLTGIEAATEFAEQYPQLRVTLVTKGTLGATLSAAGADHLRRVFARLQIELVEGVTVERFTETTALCSDGQERNFASCVWAGAFVVPPLAAAAGLPVDRHNRLLVDDCLRVVDHPTIYAAGDAAATELRMACATALPAGAYVADHLAATLTGSAEPAPFHFSYLIQCISLGRHDGLVQLVNADDTPKAKIFKGWLAARIKELICRFTVWALFWEKRWPGLYSWPQTRPILALRRPTTVAQTTAAQTTAEQVHYGQTAANL